METILPCHPKDLLKLADGTVLSLPLKIGIAVPVEKVKFWQSDGFFMAIIVSIILLLGITGFFANGIYHGNETFAHFQKFVIITLIFDIFLTISSVILHFINNNSKRYNIPNNFLANKFKWQSKPIIEISKNHMIFYEPFNGEICKVNFDDIEDFAYSQYDKGKPWKPIGIAFTLINHAKIVGLKHYKNQNVFRYQGLVATTQFVLNDSQQLTAKQVVQILEKFRKNKNGELIFYGFDDYTIV